MDERLGGLIPPIWFEADKGGAGGGGDDPPGKDQSSDDGDQDEKGSKKKKEQMVPLSRLNEVIQERNGLKDAVTKLEADMKKLQDDKLTEAEKLQQRLTELQGQFEQERLTRMRLEVATKHGIPQELIPRLQGDNYDDLETDAEALKEFIEVEETQAGGPGNPPPKKGGQGDQAFSVEGKSAEEIRNAYRDGKLSLTG